MQQNGDISPPPAESTAPEGVAFRDDGAGALTFAFEHKLDAKAVARLWEPAHARLRRGKWQTLHLDVSAVDYMDGSGLALLVDLQLAATAQGVVVDMPGLSERHAHLLALAGVAQVKAVGGVGERRELGSRLKGGIQRGLDELYEAFRINISFLGESSQAIWDSLRRPKTVRWKDVLLCGVAVGVDSLPILLLVGFLMGLIMSFQSVISLQRFGGEIYVPNMLGLVMFREMGPLTTAILLAARSGSAFAAEIGTMRVHEELDALNTMGISPVRFLVGPRILASVAVVPIMTLFFNFASLVGGACVMLSIGFPLATFTSRVFANVQTSDLTGSLLKVLVFSLLISGVGCLRGLRTGTDSSAVGRSTTGAVVSSLVLITVADGLFAVLFYYVKF